MSSSGPLIGILALGLFCLRRIYLLRIILEIFCSWDIHGFSTQRPYSLKIITSCKKPTCLLRHKWPATSMQFFFFFWSRDVLHEKHINTETFLPQIECNTVLVPVIFNWNNFRKYVLRLIIHDRRSQKGKKSERFAEMQLLLKCVKRPIIWFLLLLSLRHRMKIKRNFLVSLADIFFF